MRILVVIWERYLERALEEKISDSLLPFEVLLTRPFLLGGNEIWWHSLLQDKQQDLNITIVVFPTSAWNLGSLLDALHYYSSSQRDIIFGLVGC